MEADDLGDLLRRTRLDNDLTLERLSVLSGISDRTLGDIERGVVRGPQHRTVLAIAEALGLPGADRAALLQAARAGRRGGPTVVRSASVPCDVRDLTGRSAEVARVTGSLTGERPRTVVVTGPPGHGKTSLAVRAAHLLRAAFPDQVFVDLGGTTREPPSPEEVATRVLRALTGWNGPPARAGDRLRGLLAGRRALLVLDDAAAEHQVRALQQVAGRSAVLVTSRRLLSGLDAVDRVPVAGLPDADARRLLAAIVPAGQAAGADLTDLARWCDGVPLALRIVGNRLASRPGCTAAALAERLAVRNRRLDVLTAGDLQMRTAIQASVDQLRPTTRELFLRLPLLDAEAFPAALAAGLVGASRAAVDDMLDELAELNLVRSAAGDSYALGGLLRLYAEAELATRRAVRSTPSGNGRRAADGPRGSARARRVPLTTASASRRQAVPGHRRPRRAMSDSS